MELLDRYKKKAVTRHQSLLKHTQEIQQLLQGNRLLHQFPSVLQTIHKYEDPLAQEAALAALDLERFYAGADERVQQGKYSYSDCLVLELLHWFKHDFFKWTNEPQVAPHLGKPVPIGAEQANAEEQRDGATRTEVYRCSDGSTVRFPRYNNPVKLLQTRNGRCGEWANCFCLILRAMGVRTRYVWNLEDHVWCEVYSQALARWVHVDSCEEAFDKPTLYNKGWGKAMSYCFAVGVDGVQDVSRRYVVDPTRAIPRDKVDEAVLRRFIALSNAMLRTEKSEDEIMMLSIEDYFDTLELNPASTALSQPRQSGSAEWTKARGESG